MGVRSQCLAPKTSATALPLVLSYARPRRRRFWIAAMAVVLLIVGYGENRWLHSELRARRDEVRYQINSNLSQARDSRRTENLLDARISVDRARLAAALEPESFLSVERRYFTWRIDREEARVDELFRAHPAADLDLHRGCRFDAGPLV